MELLYWKLMQSCRRKYSVLVLNIVQPQLTSGWKNGEKLEVSPIRTRPKLGPFTLLHKLACNIASYCKSGRGIFTSRRRVKMQPTNQHQESTHTVPRDHPAVSRFANYFGFDCSTDYQQKEPLCCWKCLTLQHVSSWLSWEFSPFCTSIATSSNLGFQIC